MSNKYLWLGIAGVVMLAGLIFWNSRGTTYVSDLTEQHAPTPRVSVGTGEVEQFLPAPTEDEVVGRGPGAASPNLNYSQLVAEYQGRRLQFDMNCQVSPSSVTYKRGTKVMFDNRSGDPRYIRIGPVSYYFPGYGFRILTMSASTAALPYTVVIDCGSAQNVGNIIIQQ